MLEALMSGDIKLAIAQLLLTLPIVFLSLSVHETAHGYVAYKLGDPTARNLGRLTLNPIKHLDLFGTLCMVLFGFGWAKPVPINTRYFKKPKRDMALTGIAGPISNLLLAVGFALVLKLVATVAVFIPYTAFVQDLFNWTVLFLSLGIRLNITLMVFNLIPIPPLDGSRLLFAVLPVKAYFKVMQYERYIYIAFLVLLALGAFDVPIDFITGLVEWVIYKAIL